MKMCYEAIGSSGGNYIAIEIINTTVKYTRKDVHAEWFLAGDVMGDGVLSPEYKQFGKHFFALAEKWFHEGMVRPHPPQILADA